MGLLNSSLHIGRTALLSYQGALQVVGNNISSAASPDYTRLTAQLDPLQGNHLTRGLQPGAGVALADIQRHLDESLESRLRLSISHQQAAEARLGTLGQVESYFDDLTGNGVGTRLRTFLHSFDELQNAPEDAAIRDLVLANGTSLAGSLRTLRQQLADLGKATDDQISDLVEEANQLVAEVAKLNERITRAEAGGPGLASGLRDQRDALLRRLTEFFDVTTFEQPDGAINVYIGSEALAQGSSSRGLTVVTELEGEFQRTSVRFADTQAEVPVRDGRLQGLIAARDDDAYGRLAEIDQLAAAIGAEVNRIHVDGLGLQGWTTVSGAVDVLATNVPLNSTSAGLPLSPTDGSFFITVTDSATGTPVAHEIQIRFGGATPTTLESLVADVNAQVDGVTAAIAPDQRLVFTADAGFSFSFGHDGQHHRADTSGVLAALGINVFFTGRGARDLAVHEALLSDPRLIAAAQTPHPGDGTNAGRLAALDSAAAVSLDGASLTGFYNALFADVAVDTAAGRENAEAADTVLSSLQAQKESVSGVNLDEEAISLLKYERAFQGASRFISVVDDLLNELVTLVR